MRLRLFVWCMVSLVVGSSCQPDVPPTPSLRPTSAPDVWMEGDSDPSWTFTIERPERIKSLEGFWNVDEGPQQRLSPLTSSSSAFTVSLPIPDTAQRSLFIKISWVDRQNRTNFWQQNLSLKKYRPLRNWIIYSQGSGTGTIQYVNISQFKRWSFAQGSDSANLCLRFHQGKYYLCSISDVSNLTGESNLPCSGRVKLEEWPALLNTTTARTLWHTNAPQSPWVEIQRYKTYLYQDELGHRALLYINLINASNQSVDMSAQVLLRD